MDISIIIVNYNTVQLTKNCIDSIYKQTKRVSFEIIVVDNASTDGSKQVLENDCRIRYIYSKENMGFGRANNVGMMLAQGDYIFLLNSDTILLNNAIDLFYEKTCNRSELAFYGAWLLKNDKTIHHSYANLPTMRMEILNLIKGYFYKLGIFSEKNFSDLYVDQDFYEVGYITGAAMFFCRDLYVIHGGFDSSYFLYYEETDWQARLKKEGIKSYVIQGPLIIHLEGASSVGKNGKKNNKTKKIYTESKFHYFKKHSSFLKSRLFKLIYKLLSFPITLISRD